MIAEKLDYPGGSMSDLQRGALLHDIGKIGIPDAILRKPGPLTEEEWEIMRQHPEFGRRMLAGIPFLAEPLEIIYAHQERYDGTGYPQGLAGEAIPLGARIFAVVDAFDAMTSDRPYRKAQPLEVARQRIVENSGTQFDPAVVDAFMAIPEAVWVQELRDFTPRSQVGGAAPRPRRRTRWRSVGPDPRRHQQDHQTHHYHGGQQQKREQQPLTGRQAEHPLLQGPFLVGLGRLLLEGGFFVCQVSQIVIHPLILPSRPAARLQVYFTRLACQSA